MGGDPATWSIHKKIFMIHTTVTFTLSFILLFTPTILPQILQTNELYAGLLFLFSGLFCTIPDTPATVSYVF